ncbi:MAG: hypothetical protein PHI12_09045 [Dehalococcoidales bacterium]|nr:hypothetical protein [Dehalococcoidales bacterium]
MNRMIERIQSVLDEAGHGVDKRVLFGALKDIERNISGSASGFSRSVKDGALQGTVQMLAGFMGSILWYLAQGAKGTRFAGVFEGHRRKIADDISEFANGLPYTDAD